MKKYKLREKTEMSSNLEKYSPLMQDLFAVRGIDNETDAEVFLNPSYESGTFDPFLLPNMERAVERILNAIKNGEKICVYSDYDHDGIPGGVVLREFFKKINYENVFTYIPHRYAEGYGMHEEAMRNIASDGATLLITVDCGITDVEPVEVANENNLDVIITDHHLPQENLPKAYAIVNPKLIGSEYPDPMLCGAAVAFKLVQALIVRGDFEISEGWEKWLLDLVGLSTIADMVPLRNENRVLAHFGLLVLKKTPRVGLRALMKSAGVTQTKMNEDDVGFSIAPRINAASRMGDPMLAFNTLMSNDSSATVFANELERLNNARKGAVGAMVREMHERVTSMQNIPDVIVMGHPSWRPGLLGLAASSLVSTYGKPAFLWGREGGDTLKGSCRSDGVVNVVSLMQAVTSGVFVDFGGHAFSGGFSINFDASHTFDVSILEAYEKVRESVAIEEDVLVDRVLHIDEINSQLFREVFSFAPFGMGNPKPTFLMQDVTPSAVKIFGKTKEHLELAFNKTNGGAVKAIAFFHDMKRLPEVGKKINVVVNLEQSFFAGRTEQRLRVVDIF